MNNHILTQQQAIAEKGFTIIDGVFSDSEISAMVQVIEHANQSNQNFRKTEGLFAIRQFIKEVAGVIPHIFTEGFISLISEMFGKDYFLVKSIYFDKPEGSNWFVSYHQDLTISVDKKSEIAGYGPWTVKHNQFAVQPPLDILENNFTVRIHLDDTNENNGALKVIEGSHLKSIYRAETIDWDNESETICNVPKGGIMIMKPLLLHASGKSKNNQKRRVIHLEFSNQALPSGLNWAEMHQFQ